MARKISIEEFFTSDMTDEIIQFSNFLKTMDLDNDEVKSLLIRLISEHKDRFDRDADHSVH